jgi:hypothetical protein
MIEPDKAFWCGWHLGKFLDYCRTHPLERADLRVAARAYFDAMRRAEPPEPQWRIDLLGHNSIETTQIYTHVMTSRASAVRSPLDA